MKNKRGKTGRATATESVRVLLPHTFSLFLHPPPPLAHTLNVQLLYKSNQICEQNVFSVDTKRDEATKAPTNQFQFSTVAQWNEMVEKCTVNL